MFPVPGAAYDRAITIFSPDGRLFQVEYAMKAVERGTPVIGVRTDDAIVLVVAKKYNPLLEDRRSLKLFLIDDHIVVGVAGITSDARVLVDEARVEAQNYQLTYGEPIDVLSLTQKICDIKQAYTRYGGVRPFGVSFLIAGVDDSGPHLYMTDPLGTYWEYRAVAIGLKKDEANELLKKGIENVKTLDDAISLALRVLNEISEEKLSKNTCEIAYVTTKEKKVKILIKDDVEPYLAKALGSK